MQMEIELAKLLVGRQLTRVERWKENEAWSVEFQSGVHLAANCSWRIIAGGRIAHGYDDDGQKFGLPSPVDGQPRAMELLSASQIIRVTIRNDSGDLSVEFDGGAKLELFNDSSGYEGWQCSGGGISFIAQGGGNIVWFPPRNTL